MNAEHRVLVNAGEPVVVQWRSEPAAVEQALWDDLFTRKLAPRFRESHIAGFTMAGPDGWYTTVLVPPQPPTPEELVEEAVASMREALGKLQDDTESLVLALGDAMSKLLRGLGHVEVAFLWDSVQ